MQKGEVLDDRFEIEFPSGSGGMGQVYRGRDRSSDLPVAIKVLHRTGPLEIERFSREAELLATLTHPSIVRYISGGATPSGEPYLVMEWLEGESLSERLKRLPLTLSESLSLGVKIAHALGSIHRRAVVHRDVKPSNIFLRGGSIDDVTLIDFGIARGPDAGRQLTMTGAMLGTPGYIAPEQAHGVPDIDPRADVFSLGCVLFRCVSGHAPFHGTDPLSVLLKVAVDEPPRLRELKPHVPAELDDLVARMLCKVRDERPRDGAAVADELSAIADLAPQSSGVRFSPRRMTGEITGVERRVMSIVLVRRRDRSGDATLPAVESGAAERAIRSVVERHKGKLEILADGSLLVLLASAEAATDLAARAARCALALRSLVEGAPVAVVSGREILGPRLPTGELIERAVQMIGDATTASSREGRTEGTPISIDEVTAGLLGPHFDFDNEETRYSLRGEHREPDGRRPLLGKPTECVGRERELVQLDAIFDQCMEERVAAGALLTAPAGIGKSRVVHEFLRKLRARGDDVEVWFGQGDPMSAGSAFALLSQALRAAFGIDGSEPIEVRRQKIRERVALRLKTGTGHVAELLGELVGTPFPDDASPELRAVRQDPVLRGEQMRRAFLSFLRAECAAQPVLIVLEDLHWGDVPTVRFIDAALVDLRELPFMILAAARTEVHALFPRIWAGRHVQELRLRELSRRASERLVRQVLGDDIGEDTLRSLIERADGHAFYLEELIRAAQLGKGQTLPETVLAMVQARLERLDPEARRVLRAASLFGETFWQGGVDALLGNGGAAAWLTELAEHEVIARSDQGRFPGEVEYRFRHALLREAAYGMLTEEDRTLGHRLAGAWLEQAGETDAMVLAEHFERGEVQERAITWFLHAAELALGGGDLDAVVTRADRGLHCGAAGAVRGVLLAMQGYVHVWRTSYREAAACYREAIGDLPRGSLHWHWAVGGGIYSCASTGEFQHVTELIEELRAVLAVKGLPIPPIQGMSAAVPILCVAGHYALAREFIDRFSLTDPQAENDTSSVSAGIDVARCHFAHFSSGDAWSLLAHASAALARGERTGEARVIYMAQAYQGLAQIKLGDLEEGEARLRSAREAARERGLHLVGQFADLFLADALTERGALDEAHVLLDECHDQAFQSALWGAVWTIASSRIARRRGDYACAERLLHTALDVCGPLAPGYTAHAYAILSVVEHERGDDRAVVLGHALEALRLLDSVGTWYNDIAIRARLAELFETLGEIDTARQLIVTAHAQVEARAAAIDDVGQRTRLLTRVPEIARVLAMARRFGIDAPEHG
ncbi:Adenylate cyclase [Minicystis rosea]|nr:Adenylate cyclase [Minicystis rosea]